MVYFVHVGLALRLIFDKDVTLCLSISFFPSLVGRILYCSDGF